MNRAMPGMPTVAGAADLAVVVIGRNEGDRLARCLSSIGDQAPVVYVDSGSTDGSVALAAATGAQVVALDLSIPFTAARARNAGRSALDSNIAWIQFIDGDCQLQPGWLSRARSALTQDPGLAAVFGRRREVAPDASTYNWLCDTEWAVPAGSVRQFGGDAMLRAAALDAASGYPAEMIAGEEPDLSMRLGALGWRIECLAEEMTLHDAAITRFSQWWRRVERSGHAYAELDARHPGEWRRRVRAALFWGAGVPGGVLVMLLAAILTRSTWAAAAAGLLALLPIAQFFRVARREARVRAPAWSARDAATWSLFLLLDKPPHALGIARYWWSRVLGQRTALIEYKDASVVDKNDVTDGLWRQIAADWRAHERDWTRPGFRAVATHRFGVWRMGVHPKLLRAPLSLLYRWMFRHCRNRYGIELPYTVKLGQGVIIEHQGAIVIHGGCEIGDGCIIRQGCTLGLRRLDDLTAAPVLEAHVELGAGSVVLGRVRLGLGARVGANAVVLDDVAPGTTVWGIPAATTRRRKEAER